MPPKKISIVRHGQGYHNVTHNYDLRDPLLTPLGHKQCAELSASYPHHNSVDVVIASPIRRTIQTAAFSFGPALARPEVPFLLDPKLQELGSHDADRGLDPADLKAWLEEGLEKVDFPREKIDVGGVVEGWNSKKGYYAYEAHAIHKRAADVRSELLQRTEDHVVVVTHGAIAHFLTEDYEIHNPMLATNWANCEVRDFVFAEGSRDGDAHLVETRESRGRRPPFQGERWVGPWEESRSGEKDGHVVEEVRSVREAEVQA